jgi:hypothetical protein
MAAAVSERPRPSNEGQPSLEGAPTGEGLTFEKVWAMFQAMSQETDQKIQDIAERQRETDRQFKETDRRFKETERLMKENAKRQKETYQSIGKLNNRFGDLVEHLVAPNISEKFNELGFCFTRTGMNIKIKNPQDPKDNAEVDILLENGDIVVAVEVKAKPNDEDVDDHVQRMDKLRRHADEKQDKRRYQGAIAGALMNDSVRSYILKKGFYVIEQTGDTVRINIPQGFKARDW